MQLSDLNKTQFIDFLHKSQNSIISMFHCLDPEAKLTKRSWNRNHNQGGGNMQVLRGSIVEKAGCNVSTIYGENIPDQALQSNELLQQKLTSSNDRSFFATGLSTINHMFNPHAPIAHMNVRMFEMASGVWFGGGADLTPFISYKQDNHRFFQGLKQICINHHPNGIEAFNRYKQHCDRYFYIKHRKQIRGVGGIFFDNLSVDFNVGFNFIKALVENYLITLEQILTRTINLQYTSEQKTQQLYWRGRYVEFNLIYDRGTKFGLESGGDVDAIFVSLPPQVKW